MKISDLEQIFKPQLDEGVTELCFMVVNGYNIVSRYPANNMKAIAMFLKNHKHAGSFGGIPRFVKDKDPL